ncbi:hypothetical protein BCV70DRAFT_109574 [Testicularia cyperi]|uniref:Uncharacterized protein n=1 Tax=Testicularia cyperi TaxID=1882483 RepID=A0A317XHW5_9BASI|nr:hypothetical protein BCV70DRAFT_109574 [Testicularia cyperi]
MMDDRDEGNRKRQPTRCSARWPGAGQVGERTVLVSCPWACLRLPSTATVQASIVVSLPLSCLSKPRIAHIFVASCKTRTSVASSGMECIVGPVEQDLGRGNELKHVIRTRKMKNFRVRANFFKPCCFSSPDAVPIVRFSRFSRDCNSLYRGLDRARNKTQETLESVRSHDQTCLKLSCSLRCYCTLLAALALSRQASAAYRK